MEAQKSTGEKRIRKYDTEENKGNRHGVFWSVEENLQLLAEISQNMSMAQIAETHKRTPSAIELHLSKLAAKECIETGVTAAVVASRYRVTEAMVNREVKHLQRPKRETKKSLEERVGALEAEVAELKQCMVSMAVNAASASLRNSASLQEKPQH